MLDERQKADAGFIDLDAVVDLHARLQNLLCERGVVGLDGLSEQVLHLLVRALVFGDHSELVVVQRPEGVQDVPLDQQILALPPLEPLQNYLHLKPAQFLARAQVFQVVLGLLEDALVGNQHHKILQREYP